MARVFNDLVFLVGPWMLGDQFFFIIEGDPLIIGFKSEHAGGIDKGDTVAIGFEADQILRTTFDSLGQTRIVIDRAWLILVDLIFGGSNGKSAIEPFFFSIHMT